MQNKIVIFDWGGVILNHYPDKNNQKEAIIRTIRYFNSTLTDEEAYSIYENTLLNENGIYISAEDSEESKIKWVNRIKNAGKFETTVEEFSKKFETEYEKIGYYKEVVDYIQSLKEKCKIGLFSDLIYTCYTALDKQVDLSQFDYVWLSYQTHLRKDKIEAFMLVEEDTQIPPDHIMFIDDTTRNIENAKKRGWYTCQARGSDFPKIKEEIEKFLTNEKELKLKVF